MESLGINLGYLALQVCIFILIPLGLNNLPISQSPNLILEESL